MLKRLNTGLVSVVLTFAGTAAAQSLLLNGDFEAGALDSWSWTPDPGSEPGMTPDVTTGPWGSPAFRINPGSTQPGAVRGGSLAQSIHLTGGVSYTYSFDVALQNLSAQFREHNWVQFRINEGAAWTYGTVLFPYDLQMLSYESGYIPPSTGDYTFSWWFGYEDANYPPVLYHWADNLTVIPEPSTLIFALGAGCVVLCRRVRQQAPRRGQVAWPGEVQPCCMP